MSKILLDKLKINLKRERSLIIRITKYRISKNLLKIDFDEAKVWSV